MRSAATQYTLECVNVRTHVVQMRAPRLRIGRVIMHYCQDCNDVTAHEVVRMTTTF